LEGGLGRVTPNEESMYQRFSSRMHTIAMRDGIGEPNSEIAKLAGHGFVEISTANAGLGVI
jgi:hypothetical protein